MISSAPSSSASYASSAADIPSVAIDGEVMSVRFGRFDLAAYGLFLKVKRLPEYQVRFEPADESYTITAPSRFASMLGVASGIAAAAELPLWPALYDDQAHIVSMALAAKRYACWSDCGLGKTYIEAEFARQVAHSSGGRVLIFTLNDIVPQWLEMVQEFYQGTLAVRRLASREEMKAFAAGTLDGPAIAITNYEKLNHKSEADQVVSELRMLDGIVADESSRLKTGGGKQKWALIKSAKGIPYKLSCTATPAPNEIMEFASQASFLEKMRSDNEIIWTYFRRDEKTHRWTVKKHARKAFFEFMAGWSIYVRDPSRYGWRLDAPKVPDPQIIEHVIEPTAAQREMAARLAVDESTGMAQLFRTTLTNTIQRAKLSQIAKGFVYRKGGEGGRVMPLFSRKPGFICDLVNTEVTACRQVLVWTVFDAESDILAAQMQKRYPAVAFELLTGKTSDSDRLAILERFRHGQTAVLISRAVMLGYGMNFQHCGAMIFSGFSDSYEQFYQALRRAYRPGQKQSLRVHIPYIPLLEEDCWENILRKKTQHEAAIAEMEANYIAAAKVHHAPTKTPSDAHRSPSGDASAESPKAVESHRDDLPAGGHADPGRRPRECRPSDGRNSGQVPQRDPLFDQALVIVTKTDRMSVSLIQRRLGISYSRAARILTQISDSLPHPTAATVKGTA